MHFIWEKKIFILLVLFVSYFEEKVNILYTHMDSTNEHKSPSIKNIPHFSVHWTCIYLYHGAFLFVIDVIQMQTPEVQYVE